MGIQRFSRREKRENRMEKRTFWSGPLKTRRKSLVLCGRFGARPRFRVEKTTCFYMETLLKKETGQNRRDHRVFFEDDNGLFSAEPREFAR